MSGPGRGGVTEDTVMNVMHDIRDAKVQKRAEIIEKKQAGRSATKAADISENMKLGKSTVEKPRGH